MLAVIFYIFVIPAVIYECFVLSDTQRILNAFTRIRNSDDVPELLSYFSLLSLLYKAWIIVGWFSSQWYFFAAIFLMSLITKDKTWKYQLDAALTLLLLFCIVVFKYHLF